MADSRRLVLTPQLDIEQILREAQHRWLRPLEICEILRNYGNFRIAPEPPNKPPSGSLFLFDRKVLRYFRKDGHNWRKKRDGKTVKEAHEKLKAGSVDVLHCYYAHGEDSENFQRRSYWMLEEELMHIVLVHYREVKGSKSSYLHHREDIEITRASQSHPDSPASSNLSASLSQVPSQITDYGSPNSTQQSEYEDADSDNYQSSSRYNSFPEMQQHGPRMKAQLSEVGSSSLTQTDQYLAPWGNFLEGYTMGFQAPSLDISVGPTEYFPQRNSSILQDIFSGDASAGEDGMILLQNTAWQLSEAQSHVTSNTNNQVSDTTHEDGGLKKYDSFSRWMSNELGEVDDSQITSSSATYWSPLESDSVVVDSSLLNQEQADNYLMSPSLSQDQLFSIIDFSPHSAFADRAAEITVKGRFLMNEEEMQKYKWSCMFGEIEVPAYTVTVGTLCCRSPAHKPGRVPFYVTGSNRLACSEVREFEFKANSMDVHLLRLRLDKLLSPIAEEEEEEEFSAGGPLLEDRLKHKLRAWLLRKAGEEGKGPNVLDKEGQGVLHLAAALGYDWAIKPTVAAGVNINFRDAHGWTAVHWAAFYGRESTVVTLIALDASPGALTDPTPEFPSGSTPADLASQNGHKGIAGFLAESSLSSHLRTLTLKDPESRHLAEEQCLSEKNDAYLTGGEIQASLSAVRNATEAAARIYQVFRVQSFNRKKINELAGAKYAAAAASDEQALSRVCIKAYKAVQGDMPAHAAAIKIQNKFRGWKGRKEFLITRQRIVKIQAHVRGHQVRKQYRKIIWSVGIVEKVILRWRRKGSGLRGFRSEGLLEGPKAKGHQPAVAAGKEDDYDFLQVGRKQTEARLQKALARVKSMVQYPEARDQYRRLITGVTELQASKLMQAAETQSEVEEPSDTDLVMQIEGLLGDEDMLPSLL